MNIYVGFLPPDMDDQALGEKFEPYGEVLSAQIIKDRETGLSRGFGFVEMKNEEDGRNAIEGLKSWVKSDGRYVKVKEAEDRRQSDNRGRSDNRSDNRGGGRRW